MSAALAINGLVKRFGGLTATNDVTFQVHSGQSVGLIGPNGAGKTTIFSQVMGELRQDSGTISLFGNDISRMSIPERIRQGVCRTYQVPRPFSELEVAENIRVGLMENSVWQMLSKSPNHELEEKFALDVGFDRKELTRTPAELSMGDLRKLEMARTLATSPKVVLLDEVFAGLSVGEIATISALIQKLRESGITFVIVSHDLKALEPLIDSAIAINHGQVIAEGDFNDVINDDAVRTSYLGSA